MKANSERHMENNEKNVHKGSENKVCVYLLLKIQPLGCIKASLRFYMKLINLP